MSFGIAIEFTRALPCGRSPRKRRLESLLDKLPTQPLDRGDADLQRSDDSPVFPRGPPAAASALSTIRARVNFRAAPLPRRVN